MNTPRGTTKCSAWDHSSLKGGGGYIEITHVDDSHIKQSRELEIAIYMHDVNTEYYSDLYCIVL